MASRGSTFLFLLLGHGVGRVHFNSLGLLPRRAFAGRKRGSVLREEALDRLRITSASDDERAAVVDRSLLGTFVTSVERNANKFIISDDVTGEAAFISSVAVLTARIPVVFAG